MLGFSTLRSAAVDGGAGDVAAFLTGFQGVFRLVALLPALVVSAALARGWGRKETSPALTNLSRGSGRGRDA
jgi:hypothetical protein